MGDPAGVQVETARGSRLTGGGYQGIATSRRLSLDQARALVVFQLTFTDLDPAFFPPGTILPLFAHLGLVTVDLMPKPSLATWDSLYARPHL